MALRPSNASLPVCICLETQHSPQQTEHAQQQNKRAAVRSTTLSGYRCPGGTGKRLPTDMESQRAAYSETRSQPETAFENGIRYTYPTRETPLGANCPRVCSPTTALDFTEQSLQALDQHQWQPV